MGFKERVFPELAATRSSVPARDQVKLATHVEDGLIRRVPNPPNVAPTSPLTNPISVVSAVSMLNYGTVSRRELLSIPAARGAIQLIAGVAGQLPYKAYANDTVLDVPWLSQPERLYPGNYTYTHTALDILLDGAALWRVTEKYADGWPQRFERIAKTRWSQDANGYITVDGNPKTVQEDLRLFPSPFDGLLSVCSPTVRMYHKKRAMVERYLDNPQAREYFQGVEGQEPEPEEIRTFLAEWNEARRQGLTGFVPAGVQLKQVDLMTPEQLSLRTLEETIIAEFARMMNVDPSWLALSITTRQYSNIIDERRNFLDFVCMPQTILPIEKRLGMDDITRHGTKVKATVDAFLRADTLSRFQAHAIALDKGFETMDEVRSLEDRPPLETPPASEDTSGDS